MVVVYSCVEGSYVLRVWCGDSSACATKVLQCLENEKPIYCSTSGDGGASGLLLCRAWCHLNDSHVLLRLNLLRIASHMSHHTSNVFFHSFMHSFIHSLPFPLFHASFLACFFLSFHPSIHSPIYQFIHSSIHSLR